MPNTVDELYKSTSIKSNPVVNFGIPPERRKKEPINNTVLREVIALLKRNRILAKIYYGVKWNGMRLRQLTCVIVWKQ